MRERGGRKREKGTLKGEEKARKEKNRKERKRSRERERDFRYGHACAVNEAFIVREGVLASAAQVKLLFAVLNGRADMW